MDTNSEETALPAQEGIRPRMFKALVGAGHPEFSTMRQQDALEFFQHIISLIQKKERAKGGADPSASLVFKLEEKITCNSSHRSRITQRTDNILSLPIPLDRMTNPEEFHAFEAKQKEAEAKGEKLPKDEKVVRPIVPLEACLQELAAPEIISDFFSSAIQAKTTATKTTRVATFPDILVFHMRKFVLTQSWIPKKLDVFINVPDELDLEWLRAKGLGEGEQALPDDGAGGSPAAAPEAKEEIVQALEGMGFPRIRCMKAALATNNAGAEEAMNWLFGHMEDPDIDDPLPTTSTASSASASPAVSEEALVLFESMGFTRSQALRALKATDNNIERATDWIFSHAAELEAAEVPSQTAPASDKDSLRDGLAKYRLLGFISHMGASTQTGHYVAHIRKDGQWILYNDAKVALSEDTPTDMGYLYFYERV